MDYEVLDVMHMELPPGFRGYGVRNIIDHPLTALRQAEVEEMRAAETDRHALQSHLMAFKQYLPERYRSRNARLDEPLP